MQPVKLETKAAAAKANQLSFTNQFQAKLKANFLAFKRTEKYLYSVLYLKGNCDKFNDLRCILYTKNTYF